MLSCKKNNNNVNNKGKKVIQVIENGKKINEIKYEFFTTKDGEAKLDKDAGKTKQNQNMKIWENAYKNGKFHFRRIDFQKLKEEAVAKKYGKFVYPIPRGKK